MRPIQENTATKRQTMRLRDSFSSYKCFEVIATPSPIAPINENHNSSCISDNRNSNNNLHRATSLDSLANSSEPDSSSDSIGDGGGSGGGVGDADDVDTNFDIETVTTYSQVDKKSSKAQQIHRKSDLEDLKCEPIPKEPVIKAYLEKSHRKCDYKKCEYKKSDSQEKIKCTIDDKNVNKSESSN